MIQAHIYYSGNVQGVGFRYTVRSYAKDTKVAGWVKNLSDGRVEALMEGPKEEVEKLLGSIEDHFGGYIKDKEIHFGSAQGNLKEFQIAF